MPPETLSESLLPPQSLRQPRAQLPKLRATGKKDGKRLKSQRSKKKHPKDSTGLQKNKSSVSRLEERSNQAGDSLRWEGVLEDPQAEEKRLELYRANRRQRYIAHREALLKDNQDVFFKDRKERKALAESDQQVDASLLHLRLN